MARRKKKKTTSRQRQKKQQKLASKRKQKRSLLARWREKKRPPSLYEAAKWPLHELLISESWRDPLQFTQILIVRRGPAGWYGVGLALVDQACLGVKSAFGRVVDEGEYREIRSRILKTQDFTEGDIHLAAKIIREAIAYARRCGIDPDPDVQQALVLLQDADPDACQEDIPLGGPEGKPFFIAGPYDNVPKIMLRLEKHLGPDGFNYLFSIDPAPWDDIEIIFDEEWDEREDKEAM